MPRPAETAPAETTAAQAQRRPDGSRASCISTYTSLRKTGTDRGAVMPSRTFSPMIASTEISILSPIMML